jgi:hypothetical protein
LVRLLTAKSAGVGSGVHRRKDSGSTLTNKPLSLTLSPLVPRGEREINNFGWTVFVPPGRVGCAEKQPHDYGTHHSIYTGRQRHIDR